MLCISNPHHNTIGLSPCLATSEHVNVRDVSESHRGLYSQEGTGDDTAQALHQPFLSSLLFCRAVPQKEIVFSSELKMQEESNSKHMLAHF